ncbi:hypothetical protein DFJ73DRAFT_531000 [Zopfochytrium polystomum]|nr:hypothetical protein DFJ73DRAFT_531000 [Zopfochytrium polystomum]
MTMREDDGKEDAEMGTGTVFADVILIVDQTSLGFGTLSCELNPPSTEAFNVRWTGELYGPPDAAERRDQAGENLGDDNHNHRDVGLAAKVASRGGGGRAPVRSCRLRWAEGDIGRVVAPRDAAASYDDAATASDMSAIAKAGFLVRDGVLVQFGFASSDSAKRFADALTSALSTVACNVVEGDSEGEDGDDDLDSNDIDDDGHDDQDSRAGDLAAVLARLDEEEQAELRRVKERFSAMRADKEREHAERVVAAAAAAEAEARREKKRGRGRRRRRNAPLDTTAAAAERESGDEPRECLVCCDDPEEFQIKPCGHRLCGSCAAHIYWNEDAAPRDAWKCPWDRGVVQDIVAIRGMSRDGGEDPR